MPGPDSVRTRARPLSRSEEAHRLRAVTHQQVFGLLIVIQHHLMVLAADPGLLVTAKRRMGRIQVIAVCPDAAGLKPSPHPIRDVDVSRPYGRPQAVERIVADDERFGFILERRKESVLGPAFFVLGATDRKPWPRQNQR